MKTLYIIEGGIGKHVAFTALLPQLMEKAEEPVSIHTPYPEVFFGNPNVDMIYPVMANLNAVSPSYDNIEFAEPYKSNFAKGDEHLIEAYAKAFGVKYNPNVKPQLFPADELKDEVKKWLKDSGIKEYILVQFTGGQSPLNGVPPQYISMNADKNYPAYFAQGVVNLLREAYPKATIVDCSLPNEPAYDGAIKCPMHWVAFSELAKKAKGIVSIDSCLQHIGAAVNSRGVVIWGNTSCRQFGWTNYSNVSAYMQKPNDFKTKPDLFDPRNIMVDPHAVVATFKEALDSEIKPKTECAHE